MSNTITCTISCIHDGCTNTASWDDEAPKFERNDGGLGSYSANRKSPPLGWIRRAENATEGQLLEQVSGTCPDCQRFAVDLDFARYTVVVSDPGVFNVEAANGNAYGQLRWAFRRWMLVPGPDGDMDTLAEIGAYISRHFDLDGTGIERTFDFEDLTFTYRMPSTTAAFGSYPDGPGLPTAFSMCLGERDGAPNAIIQCCVTEQRVARSLLALAHHIWPETLPVRRAS